MKKTIFITLFIFLSILHQSASAAISQNKTSTPPEPAGIKSTSYYDMDMSKIAEEVGLELKDEEKEMLNDLRFLWSYAVENSETIKFAIYKLSDSEDKNKKKNDGNKIKSILKPIASMAPMAAMSSTSSVLGGSALIGGSFLQEVLQGNNTPLQKHIEKVTDTDLVILAKSVEELQTKLVLSYYDYITSKKVLFMTDEVLKNRHKYYVKMQDSSDRNLVIADTFYRDAIQKQTKAREEFLIKRSSLEQLVGNEAILLLEEEQKEENSAEVKENKKEAKQTEAQPAEKSTKSLKEKEKEAKKQNIKKSKNPQQPNEKAQEKNAMPETPASKK